MKTLYHKVLPPEAFNVFRLRDRHVTFRPITIWDYLKASIFPVSLSYCLLHFTALTDHNALLTAWLYEKDVSPYCLALARGAAALAGIAGTLFWPYLRSKLGLDMSSLASLTLFLVCIGVATFGVFHTHKHTQDAHGVLHLVGNHGGYIVLGAIIASRPFLWVFDLANSQFFQERVETSRRRIILASYQTSLHQSLELLFVFICAVCVRTTHDFLPMSAVSFGSIALSLTIFLAFHRWKGQQNRPPTDGRGAEEDVEENQEFPIPDPAYQREPRTGGDLLTSLRDPLLDESYQPSASAAQPYNPLQGIPTGPPRTDQRESDESISDHGPSNVPWSISHPPRANDLQGRNYDNPRSRHPDSYFQR